MANSPSEKPQTQDKLQPVRSLLRTIRSQAQSLFSGAASKVRAADAFIVQRFPRALKPIDYAVGWLFEMLCHPAFSIIATLLLIILGVTGKIDIIVAISLGIAWLTATLWIAKSNLVTGLSIPSRLFVVVASASLFAYLSMGLAHYALSEYERQRTKPADSPSLGLQHEMNRALQPIKDVFVSFRVNIPLNHPSLLSYRKRLEKCSREMVARKKEQCGGVVGLLSHENDRIRKEFEVVCIRPGTAIWPNRLTEQVADDLFSYLEINFFVFKPIPNDWQLIQHSVQPDLLFSISGHLDDETNVRGTQSFTGPFIDLCYDFETKTLYMTGHTVPTDDSSKWRSTGKVTSILDLPGSLLLVTPRLRVSTFHGTSSNGHSLKEESAIARQISLNLVLQDVVLTIDGRKLKVPKLNTIKDKDGFPMHVARFVE